jgi:hypothetical protein
MKRLTKRLSNGEAMLDCDNCELQQSYECGEILCRDRLRNRVAAYEDTALEPEEVATVKLALMGKSIAAVEAFNGTPISRLIELAEADKDGRCVVLPCNGYSDVDIVRDGVSYRPDHWNIHLTAYAHEQNTPSGLKVGLFDIGEVERAMEGEE